MDNEYINIALGKYVYFDREKSIVSEDRDAAMKEFDKKLEDIEKNIDEANASLLENLACIHLKGEAGLIFRFDENERKMILKAVEDAGDIDVVVAPVTSTDSFHDLLISRDVATFMKNIKSADEIIVEIAKKQKKNGDKKKRNRDLWGYLSVKL